MIEEFLNDNNDLTCEILLLLPHRHHNHLYNDIQKRMNRIVENLMNGIGYYYDDNDNQDNSDSI